MKPSAPILSQSLARCSKRWPPDSEWPLFAALMVGILLGNLTTILVFDTGIYWRASYWGRIFLPGIPLLLAQTWQAWLLFRRLPARFALWTLLPLNFFFVQTQFMPQRLYFMALIATCILWGVRRRPWLWMLASIVGITSSQVIADFVYHSHKEWTNEMLVRIRDYTGLFVARRIHSTVVYGIGWLDDILCAAALAWMMPPVRPASESVDQGPATKRT